MEITAIKLKEIAYAAELAGDAKAKKLYDRLLNNHYLPRGHDMGTTYVEEKDAEVLRSMAKHLVPEAITIARDNGVIVEVWPGGATYTVDRVSGAPLGPQESESGRLLHSEPGDAIRELRSLGSLAARDYAIRRHDGVTMQITPYGTLVPLEG